MRLHLLRVLIDGGALTSKVVVDRRAQALITDEMSGPGERRLEAATHLVLSLGAGFKARDAALDAEINALVITGFKMQ